MLKARVCTVAVALVAFAGMLPQKSFGQAFGVSLQANLMPAAGGMGGAGIARPQDLQSSLALNPATLTQQKGTKFSFSGSWVEPTINMDNDANIPLASITPFESRSRRPGSIVGNIGVSQDYSVLGLPVTAGMGLLTASGLGVNYRDVTASNGTTAELVVLGTAAGAGVQLTDRLSAGFMGIVATTTLDGVFTGISAQTPDYNLRASLGLSYDVTDDTTIGAYWQTQQKHTFEDFVRFGAGSFQDIDLAFPEVYGVGIANQSLCCGRLLLALDLSYIEWSDADFFGDFWSDQFTVQAGMQYTAKCGVKLRGGYTYAEDASKDVVAPSIGGVSPQATVDYIASLFPNINEHRISAGIGLTDLLPGLDVDLFAGGMFEDERSFGDTTVSVESYWVGFGATWRFRRGSCERLCIPDQWSS